MLAFCAAAIGIYVEKGWSEAFPIVLLVLTLPQSVLAGLPGPLRLRSELAELFRKDHSALVPADIEITLDGELLGTDEGLFSLEGSALIFNGNRCRFAIYSDILETAGPRQTGDFGDPLHKYTARLLIPTSSGEAMLGIRSRSYGYLDSNSERLKKVISAWLKNSAERTVPAVMFPLEPTPDASWTIGSAYGWAAFSLLLSPTSWVYAYFGLNLPGPTASTAGWVVFCAFNSAISAVLLAFGIYGLKLATRRKRFYTQFQPILQSGIV
jgi:hypothetical protein